MKINIVISVSIIALLMLVWAGLHDIIKGGENLLNEYIVVVISAILLPILIYSLARKVFRTQK